MVGVTAMSVAVATDRPPVSRIWKWLAEIPDPEIPAVSIADLGIVRDVAWEDETLVVTVTPTYSGCPATSLINLEIISSLRSHGIGNAKLRRQLSPAWTTDWISAAGRAKLAAYDIAPPKDSNAADRDAAPRCPRCESPDARLVSRFGSTPCKASWQCGACLEPFEQFKCI